MKRNKVSIGMYLYWSRNLASMLYSKLLLLFGVRHSTSVIPEGQYCYTPDYEKNKIAESFTYYVIPCKYYKTLGKRWNGCKYLGIITDDFVFDDQCKMCAENYGDDASYIVPNLEIEPMNIHPPKQGDRNNKTMNIIRFIRLFFKMLGTPAWYQGIDHPTFWQRITWRIGPALAWKVAIMCYYG